MRGEHARRGHETPYKRRIIPACAGSTLTMSTIARIYGDHPRMRGEHVSMRSMNFCCGGSSPHARGAPFRGLWLPRPRGIIPACAGSTQCTRFWDFTARDHPRMRGEHARPSATSPP